MGVLKYLLSENASRGIPFMFNRYRGRELAQEPHIHDYFQMAYVMRGVGQHQFLNKTWTVSQGDLFVITPSEEHSFQAVRNHEVDIILLDFIPVFFEHPPESLSLLLERMQPWLRVPEEKQAFIEQLFLDIASEYEQQEEGYLLSIQLSLMKLLLLMGRPFRQSERRALAAALPDRRAPFADVIRYMQENYDHDDTTLAQAARIARMTPTYFSHSFKKQTGRSFVDVLQEIRIEHAKELICRRGSSITAACFQVGFRNLSHFIRTFKKHTGCTPTEYMQRIAGGESRAERKIKQMKSNDCASAIRPASDTVI